MRTGGVEDAEDRAVRRRRVVVSIAGLIISNRGCAAKLFKLCERAVNNQFIADKPEVEDMAAPQAALKRF